MVGALKQYLSQNDGIDALTLARPAMHRKWRSSDRNYAWEISPQPLCRKRLGKMGLLQGWCSHDQHRQEENQIRRLVWSAYRDNGSSNRRKEESVGCKQDLPEGKNYRLYSLRVVMRNDAPDAVQMNTGLTSVLVFSLVLRQVSSRPYMYDGIKQALGPSQNKTAPLKLLQAG